MSNRKRRKQTIPAIFIACEGRVSEVTYFSTLWEEIADDREIAITIYPQPEREEETTKKIGNRKNKNEKINKNPKKVRKRVYSLILMVWL